jgi:hypothetical protein
VRGVQDEALDLRHAGAAQQARGLCGRDRVGGAGVHVDDKSRAVGREHVDRVAELVQAHRDAVVAEAADSDQRVHLEEQHRAVAADPGGKARDEDEPVGGQHRHRSGLLNGRAIEVVRDRDADVGAAERPEVLDVGLRDDRVERRIALGVVGRLALVVDEETCARERVAAGRGRRQAERVARDLGERRVVVEDREHRLGRVGEPIRPG